MFKSNFHIVTSERQAAHTLEELGNFIREQHDRLNKPKLYVCDPLGKMMSISGTG